MILGDIKRDQWNEMDQDASKLNIRTLEKIFSDIREYRHHKIYFILFFSVTLYFIFL